MTDVQEKLSVENLRGVPETLLITLYGRALETRRPDAIIRDQRAVEIVESLDYDFERYKTTWTTQLNTAIRAAIFDEVTELFLATHPDGTVVNLGAGLDARFDRIDNGRVHWYDLDLPESIATRRAFFPEQERRRLLAYSLLDWAWLEQIDSPAPYLFLAEGVLPYLPLAEVQRLVGTLAERFPGAELLFDTISPFVASKGDQHGALSRTDTVLETEQHAPLRWGLSNVDEVLTWHPGLALLGQWYTLDRRRDRWRELGWLSRIGPFKRLISGPLIHLRLS